MSHTPAHLSLPWPAVTPGVPDHDDPVAVVRSYLLTLGTWEDAAYELVLTDPELLDGQLAVAEDLSRPYLTERVRARPRGSIGWPSVNHADDLLVSVNHPRARRCEVLTRQREGRAVQYDRMFVLVQRDDQWRIDSVRRRLSSDPDERWDNESL